MNFNFNTQLEQDSKEYNVQRSEYFKFQEGDNNIRVLSPSVVLARHQLGIKQASICYGKDEGCIYHGDNDKELRIKWWMWIHDLKDDKVKIAEMPYTIVKALGQFQQSEEYGFTDLPVPYIINIKAENAGTKEVKYTILPARQNSEVSAKVSEEYLNKKPIEDVVEAVKNKAKNN